ncbi:MerR family transcriptional regulator [Nocardioides marmoraquaticus]
MDDMETTSTERRRTVGEVADLVGVSVRTLHHYDALGLVRPSARSGAGYRLYTDVDLQRLQHVVVYRRLGFGLDEVAELLSEDADVVAHLRRQRASVTRRLEELSGLVEAIDHALEREMTDRPATPTELREIFGDAFEESFGSDYPAEAERRWGDTDAWAQSQERTARMTPQQWAEVKAEGDALDAALADACRRGVAPDSPEAMDLAERQRRGIEVFYDCDVAFHRCLGDMYVDDERFARRYDALAPGLAAWLRAAVHANADRQDA